MVKKLFKYEMNAYFRSMFPFIILMLTTSFLTRIIQIFETDSTVYDTVFTSSKVMYVISIIIAIVMVFITAITRFYRNLFSAEGYLSFTLPVTEGQHLAVKLLTALLFAVITVLFAVLSGCIATFGELLSEIIKAIAYLIDFAYKQIGMDLVLIAAQAVFTVLLCIASAFLLFYTCISIGQLANKNRILAAFGVYFIYYVLSQIIGTVFIILISVNDTFNNFINNFLFGTYSQTRVIQVTLLSIMAVNIILITAYTLITHTIMRKRLNLE